MRKWDIVRPSKVALSFLGAIAIAYLCIFAIAALWVLYGPQPSWYSPAVQPGAILLDVIFIATVLSGVVVARRAGLVKSAYLGAGILVGWLLALRISGPLAGLLMPHVPSQPLVTMMLYLAMVMLGAVVALRLFRMREVSGIVAAAGVSTIRAKLGRLGIGVAVGLVISGVLVTSLARVSFDVSTVERTWRVAILDAMSESFISPLSIKAMSQITGPVLASRSFEIALDGVDSDISSWERRCTLVDEEGHAIGFGNGELCHASSVNALWWAPYALARERDVFLGIGCDLPLTRSYYGGGFPPDWCGLYTGGYYCRVGNVHTKYISPDFPERRSDFLMFTNSEDACSIVRQVESKEGWPPPVESLPLPR